MRLIASNQKRVLVTIALLALVFAAIWLLRGRFFHPLFGRIYVSTMSESYIDTKLFWQFRQKAEAKVRGWLHLRAPLPTARSSDHGRSSDYGLKVGPSLLGWSSHANSAKERNGYVYMRDERSNGGNRALWEFALCAKRRLSDVTPDDLRCEFYGMNDPRGAGVFGAAWSDASILVPEGQIILARLVADRSATYVIRLARQGGARSGRATMRIEYVAVANQST